MFASFEFVCIPCNNAHGGRWLIEVDVSDTPELKKIRMKQGKTLREVAKLCGVSAPTILRWETRDSVPFDEVATYANALGVDAMVISKIIGPRVVQNPDDEKKWVDAVATSTQDRLVKLLLLTIWLFLDEEAYDVFVTPADVAKRAREDEAEVRSRWDDVMRSGFVAQRSDKRSGDLYVLRLAFPFDHEQ